MAEDMSVENISADLLAAAVEAWRAAERAAPHVPAKITHEDMLLDVLAAVLPLHAQRVRMAVADDIERHAESIDWYEGGGVWAEAIGVARNGYRDDEDGDDDGTD